MKRILSLILSVLLLFCSVPADFTALAEPATDEGTCGENAEWAYYESTHTLEIGGIGKTNDYSDNHPNQPWKAYCSDIVRVEAGEGITCLGYNIFSGLSALNTVVLPGTLTTMEEGSFKNCTGMSSITLPENLQSIENEAFAGCTSLMYISIPDSVTSIGDSVFEGCSSLAGISVGDNNEYYSSGGGVLFNKDKTDLIVYPAGITDTSYTVPYSVTSLNYKEFYGCTNLESITIPDSITSIGESVFEGCTGLTEIDLPDSVTSLGYHAYYGCNGLTSITIPQSVKKIGRRAFENCNGLTEISISDSVTEFERPMFGGININTVNLYFTDVKNMCSGTLNSAMGVTAPRNVYLNGEALTAVNIPDSVTAIGTGAFAYCTELTQITIPDSVTSIGANAFDGCTGLTDVSLPGGITRIEQQTFHNCKSLEEINIPSSVTEIGNGAFSGCSTLASVTMGNNVETIESSAFGFCKGLNSINLPPSLKTIENQVFNYCSALTEIAIPDGVTAIGDEAFNYCTSLSSVSIPGSATSIGNLAFANCGSLSSITIGENNENYSSLDGVIFNKDKTTLILYPANKTDTEYFVPESVTDINKYAFSESKNLTQITIPESVENIGSYAFNGCTGLKSVILPKNIETIPASLFRSCSSLNGVVIPEGVTSIGAYAFSGCSSLSDIIIPESVSSVEVYAFSGTSLKSITFLNRSCEIKGGPISSFNVRTVFYGFHASTAQAYANSHNRAFYPLCTDGTLNHNFKISEPYCLNEGCGAENPDYDDTYAGECGTDVYWHYDSESLTLTVFGEGAMDDSQPWASFAPYIKYVVVEEGITAVGNGSFKNCNNITRVTLPESLTSIGANAFEGCLWLRTLSVPGSVTTLGEDLFKNCRRLIFIDYAGTKAQWNSYSESVLNSQEIKEAVVRCTDGLIYDENLYVVENGAIYTADRKRLIKIIEVNAEKKFEVPSGVETISEGTCADTDVEVVNIPETVTTVDKDSLKGEGVRLVNFPDGVSALDEDAMSGETVAVVYENSATHIRLLEIAYPEILSFEMTDENTGGTVNSAVVSNRALLNSSPSYTRDKIRKNFAYSGVDIRPCITIRENGTAISSGNTSDRLFEKTYKNNRYAGKASVIIIAKAAKYNDVNEILHFGIFYNATNLTCSLSKTEYSYNGFKKSPNVTVKAPDGKTVSKSQYTVSGNSASKVGAHTVTVTFSENLNESGGSQPMSYGIKQITFVIKPRKTKVRRLKKGSKSVTVKWKKIKKQADGYQIQYSTDKSFKNAKTVNVFGAKKASKTIRGLKGGTRYYVRIQTFKKVKGKWYFSGWSSKKTVKTKK